MNALMLLKIILLSNYVLLNMVKLYFFVIIILQIISKININQLIM